MIVSGKDTFGFYRLPGQGHRGAQLYSAQMGFWQRPEPLELHERGRGPRGGGKLPCQSYAAGRCGSDIDYMERYKDFYGGCAALPAFCRLCRRDESAGHPSCPHHRCRSQGRRGI